MKVYVGIGLLFLFEKWIYKINFESLMLFDGFYYSFFDLNLILFIIFGK